MYKTYLVIFAFILIALVYTACEKSSPGCGWGPGGCGPITYDCTGISPKYSADVQPIVSIVCANDISCHAAGSTNAGGPFTTHAQVFAKRSEIKTAILSKVMPKTGALTQAQINAFICWIDSGAPNN